MQAPSPEATYGWTIAAWFAFYGTVEAYKSWRAKQRQQAVNMPAAKQSDTTVETLMRNTRRDQEIYEQLGIMLDRIGADRCYVVKFHNGEHFVDGSDLLKKSRTHETVRLGSGFRYQDDIFKNILVSQQPEEMELLLENGPSFRAVSEIREGKFKWLCKEGGVKAVARVGIYINGTAVGFVGADFGSTTEPANINEMVAFTRKIQGLLQQ